MKNLKRAVFWSTFGVTILPVMGAAYLAAGLRLASKLIGNGCEKVVDSLERLGDWAQ